MGRGLAIAAVMVIGCSHKSDEPKTKAAPAPAPAPAPVEKGPVTVIDLQDSAGALVGVGAEGVYLAKFDPNAKAVALVRRTSAGSEDVIGTSMHGFAMTDDAVYWTDPGTDFGTGGVWRAKRPAGAAEKLVSGASFPEKLVVLGDKVVYWEGGGLTAVGKDGGRPTQLYNVGGVVFAMIADDGAVYWVGGKDPTDHRLGAVTRAGEAKTIATLDGEAWAVAADDQRLFVSYESPKGRKVVALPKSGGEMTTWAEGAFDDRILVVAGGAVLLFDADGHAVEKVASPGATPEAIYRAPAGRVVAGLVASGGKLYVGLRNADH